MSLNLKNNLLKNQDSSKKAINLSRKLADLKEQLSHCTRCGACLQACFSYKKENMENFSPRGRVQLLNFLSERKILLKQNEEMLLKCINSCAQCGQCTQFCAAGLRVDNFIFNLKNFFIKPSFRTKYLEFYQRYAFLIFPFLSFAKKIKQSKEKETKTLLLTSKAGLKFAGESLKLLSFARLSKQAIYINEALYMGDKKLLESMLKNLKKEIKTFSKVSLFTDNIVLWRFLKKQAGFEKLKFISCEVKPCGPKDNIYIINNNSFKETEEPCIFGCLKTNFFVEFTQDLLHTPAGWFWRRLSFEEEEFFASCLKHYKEACLLALCAEDKVFYDRLKKKYKVKVNILTLAHILNEQGRTNK